MSVRTRFAPSPTGTLHIGGVRTALFNYLFSRHHGGRYLLRIEDTDRERSTAEATRTILESLEWLGLDPDEPPVFQSTRAARHAAVAHELLEQGHAYRCFCTPQELKAMRERAIAEGRPPRYDGRWRDRDPAEAPPGISPAIRLRAPREGETVVDDLVQGTVRVANAELDDMIILRSDGTPTYLHAVVVDDHDMAITHVIRGDDHLTNTFRQVQVYEAMGWAVPRFAHLPLIHGADGAKLSKRHGAVSALEFREQGYLPEALCNYLLRLGWGHGNLEVVGREEAIRLFDIADVGRAASRMDYAKLTHLNGIYIRAADDDRLTRDVLQRLGVPPGLVPRQRRGRSGPRVDAGSEGARQDAGRVGGQRRVSGRRPAADVRAESGGLALIRCEADAAGNRARAGRYRLLTRIARLGAARFRGAVGKETRPGRAAATCSIDGQHDEPGDRRHLGGARATRGFGSDRRGFGVTRSPDPPPNWGEDS